MSRPNPGEMVSRFHAGPRIDLAKTEESGWWLTVYRCRQPRQGLRFRIIRSTWKRRCSITIQTIYEVSEVTR